MDLAGKIAVINNTECFDADLVYSAQTYGAAAVMLVNDAQWGLPHVLGGTPAGPVVVPVLCVNAFGGEEQMWITNANLRATIGADANIQLGIDDRGKGMSWTDFSFVVPQTGLYPIHTLYEQGGGGAGFEWATVHQDTLALDGITRVLVNDASNTRSVKAYRAVTQAPLPTLQLVKDGAAWKISYTGVLKASPTVNGTYQTVTGATSPYTVPSGPGASMFYRAFAN